MYYSTASTLTIDNADESDQGKYQCAARNSAGTRYSAAANLYVRGKYFNHITVPDGMVQTP